MTERERWIGLAGALAGVAIALAVVDGLLLWQLDAGLSEPLMLTLVRIGIVVTGVSVLASLSVRYQIMRPKA